MTNASDLIRNNAIQDMAQLAKVRETRRVPQRNPRPAHELMCPRPVMTEKLALCVMADATNGAMSGVGVWPVYVAQALVNLPRLGPADGGFFSSYCSLRTAVDRDRADCAFPLSSLAKIRITGGPCLRRGPCQSRAPAILYRDRFRNLDLVIGIAAVAA
jgi:hypothetical protein